MNNINTKRNFIFLIAFFLGFFIAIIIVSIWGFLNNTSFSCSDDGARESLMALIKDNTAYYKHNFREGYKIKNTPYTLEAIRTINKNDKIHLCAAFIKFEDRSDLSIPISYEVYEADNRKIYIKLLNSHK